MHAVGGSRDETGGSSRARARLREAGEIKGADGRSETFRNPPNPLLAEPERLGGQIPHTPIGICPVQSSDGAEGTDGKRPKKARFAAQFLPVAVGRFGYAQSPAQLRRRAYAVFVLSRQIHEATPSAQLGSW